MKKKGVETRTKALLVVAAMKTDEGGVGGENEACGGSDQDEHKAATAVAAVEMRRELPVVMMKIWL